MTPEVNCSSLLASGSFPRVACHLEGGFPGGSKVKNLPANSGDAGSISGSGRYPEGGNSNPLQCSCLKNLMDKGNWWATGSKGLQRVRHNWVTDLPFTRFNDK